MARLSEKKACPMALSTTVGVTLAKSGFRRKVRLSDVPGILNEHTISTQMISNSMGIITLENRSMPLCTPRAITRCVISMNTTAQSNGCQGDDTNWLNTCV